MPAGYPEVTSYEVTSRLPGGRPVKLDPATYSIIADLVKRGVCSSYSECIRMLVKRMDPRFYADELNEHLERAKAVAKAAGCERCSHVLEVARVVAVRLLLGHDPPCRLLRGLLEEVGCVDGEER